ncbi:protein kinase domain-containing protein [Sorangium sp. So ce1389]|uniref:bifunctional serine/threonine-protein kinase/formylglycine-generating enzyme family protein n=1 Tax=Sorangium sp. So ce1389 TaxID=3133336 RepID=UPI003F64410A
MNDRDAAAWSATVTAAPESSGDAAPLGVPRLPSRYRDQGRLAAGSFGEVRRVLDTELDRVVAMKILRADVAGGARIAARFLAETKLTAGLEHPGIIAVYDGGRLDDGRLWFTMREVRGRTIGDVIAEVHAAAGPEGFRDTASGWTFRRLVDAFARVCQAVAYAHRRGVVHRDLKPDNLMTGEFGEVMVMDWGLGRRLDAAEPEDLAGTELLMDASSEQLTRHGDVLGTPAYMPPEQARGQRALHGLPSDVYALGAVLYHLLTGRPPYRGSGALHVLQQVLDRAPAPVVAAAEGKPVPAELAAICERAMAREIDARYPDAEVVAREVVAWLDGARRREQALALVERVQSKGLGIAATRARQAALEAEARRLLEGVKPFEAVERKAPAWEREDEAARLGREAALLETEWLEGMHGALSVEPDLPEAHAALAEHYKERLLEAERGARGEDVIRFEALLRAHDRGAYGALLRGEGALTLVTDPPGASVALYRYVEEKRHLVPVMVGEIGPTPIQEKVIPKGSYLCVIRAEGRAEVRYPVLVERGGHWDGVPPGETEAFAVPLPREGELGPDEVYVPAGWCSIGGDAEAADGLPARRIWVDGFVMGRFPVTDGEYLDFVNDVMATQGEAAALKVAPRRGAGTAEKQEPLPIFGRSAGGRFVLPDGSAPDLPAVLMDWNAALLYADWHGKRRARPARLPNELEREKAARGADGRVVPWGSHLDATFACALESHRGLPGPVAVGAYPVDESPYGIRGLAGNVRNWCMNRWREDGPLVEEGRLRLDPLPPEDDDFRVTRGGTWGSSIATSRSASRFGSRPGTRWLVVGVRVTWSYPGR